MERNLKKLFPSIRFLDKFNSEKIYPFRRLELIIKNIISRPECIMNKQTLLTCVICITLTCINLFAQKVDAPYEVGKWQGFRSAAISYTFDDNLPNQLKIAVPMFNEYDFKLTLFTVTTANAGAAPNYTGLQTAANAGHEIASHTVSHGHLGSANDATLTAEMKNSQDVINSKITGQKCVTMAYPYCETGKESIVQQYYFASRGCQGFVEGSTPGNFNNISSIICGSVGAVNTTAAFKSKADNAASIKGWCVYLIHAIDNESGYSPLSSAILRESLEYLNDNPEKFWVTSFGNAGRYVKERNAVSVSETVNSDNTITVHVTDSLDNSYYFHPISVRRPLPDNWADCSVKQNGNGLPAKIVEVNFVKYVMFDVVPDNGDVILDKNGTTDVEEDSEVSIPYSYSLDQNYPNPFNPSTIINYKIPKAGLVTLKVYDLSGKEVATLINRYQNAGIHKAVFSDRSTNNKVLLTSGVYFYTLQAGNEYIETKKMILLR